MMLINIFLKTTFTIILKIGLKTIAIVNHISSLVIELMILSHTLIIKITTMFHYFANTSVSFVIECTVILHAKFNRDKSFQSNYIDKNEVSINIYSKSEH
jgi:hypothetical protein